jgi:hypothetical protein
MRKAAKKCSHGRSRLISLFLPSAGRINISSPK